MPKLLMIPIETLNKNASRTDVTNRETKKDMPIERIIPIETLKKNA